MKDLDVYIDNRALDGFIDYFLEENCELKSRRECGYCHEIAKRVVRVNPSAQKDIIHKHRNFLDRLISGDIFKY